MKCRSSTNITSAGPRLRYRPACVPKSWPLGSCPETGLREIVKTNVLEADFLPGTTSGCLSSDPSVVTMPTNHHNSLKSRVGQYDPGVIKIAARSPELSLSRASFGLFQTGFEKDCDTLQTRRLRLGFPREHGHRECRVTRTNDTAHHASAGYARRC